MIRTYKNDNLHGKRNFVAVIKYFEMGGVILDFLSWSNDIITRDFYKKETKSKAERAK